MIEKEKYSNDTYINIISSIAVSAASQVDGVASVSYESGLTNTTQKKKKKQTAVSVVVRNNLVYIQIAINVFYSKRIPVVVCNLQEKIKENVEKATCYKVKNIDVTVVGSVAI